MLLRIIPPRPEWDNPFSIYQQGTLYVFPFFFVIKRRLGNGVIKEPNLHPNAKPIKYNVTEKGCWECISHTSNINGYPNITRNGKKQNLHRYVYNLLVGIEDHRNEILHKCDNKKCINPAHLHEGTHSKNMEEAVERGLIPSQNGEGNFNSKLTVKDVKEIKRRLENKELQKDIAKDFGINRSHVSRIKNGYAWSEKSSLPLISPLVW